MSDIYATPVERGARYTSGFMTKLRPSHSGSDYAPPKPGQRNRPVYAVSDGRVKLTGNRVLAGHTGLGIIIDHGIRTDKYGSDHMQTYSGHLAKILVKPGQQVRAGQLIGYMGATGNVTGIHLHLTVICNARYIDPHAWLHRKGIYPGATAPRQAPKPTVHTVKAGETLSGIAAQHGKKWPALARANKLKAPYVIYPGQTLKL